MNSQPLTPSNPYFNNFIQVVEPTILRYTKNGRWFELHLTNAMLAMFGYEKSDTFEDISTNDQKSIIYNFHEAHGFDVTQEVSEETEEGYSFHLILE